MLAPCVIMSGIVRQLAEVMLTVCQLIVVAVRQFLASESVVVGRLLRYTPCWRALLLGVVSADCWHQATAARRRR
jgi:hypothetical protein